MQKHGNSKVTDVEVTARPKRRTFTAAYKLGVLKEVDEAKRGETGAILRREGLYWSHVTTWREEREQASLAALGKKRGPKPKRTAADDEVEKLQRENRRLQARLAQAEIIIGVQKKIAGLLGIPLTAPDLDETP